MAVDTSSQVTSLFRRSQKSWIQRLPVTKLMKVFHILGRTQMRRVLLRDFELGQDRWNELSGILSDARNPAVDGLLAVAPLELKVLQVDVVCKVLTWEK
jgi:hypothetical protein